MYLPLPSPVDSYYCHLPLETYDELFQEIKWLIYTYNRDEAVKLLKLVAQHIEEEKI